jgi:hypothetical protein
MELSNSCVTLTAGFGALAAGAAVRAVRRVRVCFMAFFGVLFGATA